MQIKRSLGLLALIAIMSLSICVFGCNRRKKPPASSTSTSSSSTAQSAPQRPKELSPAPSVPAAAPAIAPAAPATAPATPVAPPAPAPAQEPKPEPAPATEPAPKILPAGTVTDNKQRGYVSAVIHSRDHAKDAVSQQNLQSIGKAAMMYATMNDGKFPASLATLVEEDLLPEAATHDPSCDNQIYVWRKGLSTDSQGDEILAHQVAKGPDGKMFAVTVRGQVVMIEMPAQ
jgi:hypothetical protein